MCALAETLVAVGAGAVLGFVSAVFAAPLSGLLFRPRLTPRYNEAEGSNLLTPTTTGSTRRYARIRVRNTNCTRLLAKNCVAYLERIEHRSLDGRPLGKFTESIPLPWSYRTRQVDGRFEAIQQVDIPHKVSMFADVLCAEEGAKRFTWCFACPTPLLYKDMEGKEGVFLLSIVVAGEHATPKTLGLEFTWKGKWETFEVKVIEPAYVRTSEDDEMVQTYRRCLRSRWEWLRNWLRKLS